MRKRKKMRPKSRHAKELRTPKFKMQVVADKRRKADKRHWSKMVKDVISKVITEMFHD